MHIPKMFYLLKYKPLKDKMSTPFTYTFVFYKFITRVWYICLVKVFTQLMRWDLIIYMELQKMYIQQIYIIFILTKIWCIHFFKEVNP